MTGVGCGQQRSLANSYEGPAAAFIVDATPKSDPSLMTAVLFQPAYNRRSRRLFNFQPRTHQTYAGFMMPSLALLEMDGRAPCPAILHVVSRPPDLPSAGFPKKGGRRRGAGASDVHGAARLDFGLTGDGVTILVKSRRCKPLVSHISN